MDTRFIQKMCESYYYDFELDKKHIWDSKESCIKELKTIFIEDLNNIKFTDRNFYRSLFKKSKYEQYNIIYNVLGNYLYETYSDSFSNADIIDEEDLEMMNNSIDNISLYLEEGLITTFVGLTGTIFLLLQVLKRSNIVSSIWSKMVTSFVDAFKKLYLFLYRNSLTSRIRHAVIYSNLNICGKQCGINDFSDLPYEFPQVVNQRVISVKNFDLFICLLSCYINNVLNPLMEVAIREYLKCLRLSDENFPFDQLNSTTIFIPKLASSRCQPLLGVIHDLYFEFNNILDSKKINITDEIQKGIISNFNKNIDNVIAEENLKQKEKK